MEKLQTSYLDLLLIHQPFGDYYGTYRAMKELYKAGKLRAIGVSNFGPDRYLDIQHFATVKPAVNQIETHVFQQQKTAKKYLQKLPENIYRNTTASPNPEDRLPRDETIFLPTLSLQK